MTKKLRTFYFVVLIMACANMKSAMAQDLNNELIFNKSKNYLTASKLYTNTLSLITQNSNEFCMNAQQSVDAFREIFEQDQKLIDHLATISQSHVRSYANHLNENKASDFIFFNNIVKRCAAASHLPISKFKESTERALLNIQFLQIFHAEFIQSLDL